MSSEIDAYLHELLHQRMSDLYCQVEDGVEGSEEELKLAQVAADTLIANAFIAKETRNELK